MIKSTCQTFFFFFSCFKLWVHQFVNTHIRQMTCHSYCGNIELNMDAKSHFVNTILFYPFPE